MLDLIVTDVIVIVIEAVIKCDEKIVYKSLLTLASPQRHSVIVVVKKVLGCTKDFPK